MFKPFQEYAVPRHILQPSQFDDEDDEFEPNTKESPIPKVTLAFSNKEALEQFKFLLIVPETLSILSQSILKAYESESFATVNVSYSDDERVDSNDEEFDEDEQLYFNHSSLEQSEDTKSFPIKEIKNTLNSLLVVTVPKFKNKIIYNILAAKLMELNSEKIIVLGTSQLSDNSSVCKITSNNFDHLGILSQVRDIHPPEMITSICGAIVALSARLQNKDCLGLIVGASGAFIEDFEKCDWTAVEEAMHVLQDILKLKSEVSRITEKYVIAKRASSGSLYL